MKLFGPAQLRTLPRLAETQSATRKKRKQGGHNRHKYLERALAVSEPMYIRYAVSTHRPPAMQRPAPGRPRGADAASSLRTAADPSFVNDHQPTRPTKVTEVGFSIPLKCARFRLLVPTSLL